MAVVFYMTVNLLCRGANMVFLKRAQSGRQSFWQNMLFTFVFCSLQAALLFVMPPYGPLDFNPARFLLPVLFALAYVVYMVFTVMAMREGPTSLTVIITSFNPLFPIIAGVLFWGESIRWWQAGGLLLFCMALLLYNSGKYTDQAVQKPITAKWVALSLLALLFSGLAVICTRRYSVLYDGYIKEYLIVYSLTSAAACLPFVLWGVWKCRALLHFDRRFLLHTAGAAVTVNGSNTIFMMYISAFSAAFYFPLTSVLGVVAFILAGRFILKEQVSRRALWGIAVSAAALVLLAIS